MPSLSSLVRERDAAPAATAIADSPRRHGSARGDEFPFQRLHRDTREAREAGEDGAASPAPTGIYEEVIEQIKALLRERQYRPGDKLPSERELSERLGVNRNAVREAIRALTLMGVIQTRPQSGSQLSNNVEGMLRLPFEFLMLMLQPTYGEIQELRGLIEVHAAERAAEQRTDADIAQIEAALDAMRAANAALPHTQHGGAPNRRFHRAVAAATHNRLLEYVLFCLLEARSAYIRTARPDSASRVERLDEHEHLLQAIRDRDPEAARQAMRADMDIAASVGQRIQAVAEKPGAADQ